MPKGRSVDREENQKIQDNKSKLTIWIYWFSQTICKWKMKFTEIILLRSVDSSRKNLLFLFSSRNDSTIKTEDLMEDSKNYQLSNSEVLNPFKIEQLTANLTESKKE